MYAPQNACRISSCCQRLDEQGESRALARVLGRWPGSRRPAESSGGSAGLGRSLKALQDGHVIMCMCVQQRETGYRFKTSYNMYTQLPQTLATGWVPEYQY